MESGLSDQVGSAAALLPEDLVVTVETPAEAPDDGEWPGGRREEVPVQSWMGRRHRSPQIGRTEVQDRDARVVSLEEGPEGLQVHRAELREVEELLPGSAEAAGSTTGWEAGWTAASGLPGECGPGCWPLARLAAALCGWGTQFVDI